jgi:acyl-CoA thioesterase-1
MHSRRALAAAAVLLFCANACSDRSAEAPQQRPVSTASEPSTGRPAEAPPAAAPAATPAPARPRVVCLGDSLTAGLGLSPEQAYPALLERRLAAAGRDWEVVNAGVSGDTSAGGLRRLEWSLAGDVRVLVLALGANDGLRGLPPAQMRANLARIIETAQQRGAKVVLAGMEAPPNFGAPYTRDFRAVYRDLAETYSLSYVPFLLEGVAGVPALNQSDGIHPTAEGQRRIADLVWAALAPAVGLNASS